MKEQKKTGRTIYALTVLILGILIIVMSASLLFHVQTIEVSGNEYVNSSEIGESIQGKQNKELAIPFW